MDILYNKFALPILFKIDTQKSIESQVWETKQEKFNLHNICIESSLNYNKKVTLVTNDDKIIQLDYFYY